VPFNRRVPLNRRLARAVLAVPVAIAAAGCGGSSSGTPSTAPVGTFSPPTCPSVSSSKPHWPATVPATLPKPPNATVLSTTTSSNVHITKFTTPMSLRDSVLFVVGKLPKAGYVLGRGDAEAAEADAPFLSPNGQTRGLLRMVELGACETEWLLASVNAQAVPGTSPLLPPHASPSPSPLPFG
jgi:hypothetical protein